jgi:hypothetical protein
MSINFFIMTVQDGYKCVSNKFTKTLFNTNLNEKKLHQLFK